MKERSPLFLRHDLIHHDTEQFDYISELHTYLWRVVHAVNPGASGDLSNFLDAAVAEVETTEKNQQRVDELGAALDCACVEMQCILVYASLPTHARDSLAVTLRSCTAALLRHGVRTQPDAAPSAVVPPSAAPKVMGENYTPLLAAIADAVADLNGMDVAGLLARAAAALTEEHAARIDAQVAASRTDDELRVLRAAHLECGRANAEPLGYVP